MNAQDAYARACRERAATGAPWQKELFPHDQKVADGNVIDYAIRREHESITDEECVLRVFAGIVALYGRRMDLYLIFATAQKGAIR